MSNSISSSNIRVGGQVCASESCNSFCNTQFIKYGNVNWALFHSYDKINPPCQNPGLSKI
jgi:hypothetical protein